MSAIHTLWHDRRNSGARVSLRDQEKAALGKAVEILLAELPGAANNAVREDYPLLAQAVDFYLGEYDAPR